MSAEVASIGVEELWDLFIQRKREKWSAGCDEHRTNPRQFNGDPAWEARDEVADFSNYIGALLEQERITAEERDAWDATMFEAWCWLYSVMQR